MKKTTEKRKRVTAKYLLTTLLKTPSKKPREEETPLSKRLKELKASKEEKKYVQRNLELQYMKEQEVGTLASDIRLPLYTSFRPSTMKELRKSFKAANQYISDNGRQHAYRAHPLMEKMLEQKECTVVALSGLDKEKEFVEIQVPSMAQLYRGYGSGRWFFPRDVVNIPEAKNNCLNEECTTLYKFRRENGKVYAQKIKNFSADSIDCEEQKQEVPPEKVEIPYS